MSRKTSPTAGRSGEMLSDIQPMYWNEVFQSGQLVGLDLAGFQAEGVVFQAAVADAIGHIVKQTSEQPPKHLVRLLFSFRGVSEVEVPADRIHIDR